MSRSRLLNNIVRYLMTTQNAFLKSFFALILLSSALPVSAALINGDFETGSLNPWFQDRVFSAGEDWNVTNADAHTGNFSATNTGNKEIRQNFDGILTDSITELSFWAKHESLNLGLSVNLFYSDNTDTSFIVFNSTLNWENFDGAAKLISGKELVGFSIFGNSRGCDANCPRTYFDDVTISSVPIPGAVWLFGSGLLGLVGISRRKKEA